MNGCEKHHLFQCSECTRDARLVAVETELAVEAGMRHAAEHKLLAAEAEIKSLREFLGTSEEFTPEAFEAAMSAGGDRVKLAAEVARLRAVLLRIRPHAEGIVPVIIDAALTGEEAP